MLRPVSRALALLVLMSLPSALFSRGVLVRDSGSCISEQRDEATTTLDLARAAENEDDFEDDVDDVLLNELTAEHPRQRQEAPLAVGPLRSRLSTERPLRPPIG